MSVRALAIVGLTLALMSAAGCQTMSAEECAAADWRALGYHDAAERGAERILQRSESCAKKGFAADAEAYSAGFAEGLYVFCAPQRAFLFARRGGSFNGVCPAELQEEFGWAFADGQRVHEAESALQSARNEVGRLENRRDELDDHIASRERNLAEATTDEERTRLRGEIERLRRERRDINDDIRVAQANIPRLMGAVSRLRAEIGNRWGVWQ